MGNHSLLQEIFPTQGSNLGPLHCSQILYCLSHQGSYFLQSFLGWLQAWGDFWISHASGKLFRLEEGSCTRAGKCSVHLPPWTDALVSLLTPALSRVSCLPSRVTSIQHWWPGLSCLHLPLKHWVHLKGWEEITGGLSFCWGRGTLTTPRHRSFCDYVDTFVTLFTRIPYPHHPEAPSSISQDSPKTRLQSRLRFERSL